MNTEINTLDQKFHTLTDKYKLAKTSEIVKRIEGLGFKLDNFVAMKTRKKERQGFQKHRAIFTSPLLKATNDGVPQLLLTNSHDGTSSVVLQLGFFRFICSNGLVVGSNVVKPLRIRHSGNDFEDRLIAGINTMVAQAEKILKLMSSVFGFYNLIGTQIAKSYNDLLGSNIVKIISKIKTQFANIFSKYKKPLIYTDFIGSISLDKKKPILRPKRINKFTNIL
jgi:hypothetical protein